MAEGVARISGIFGHQDKYVQGKDGSNDDCVIDHLFFLGLSFLPLLSFNNTLIICVIPLFALLSSL